MEPGELDPSEHALREAVLAGSETAWRALYEANFDSLYTFIWHRAGRQTYRADEVAQETWLVAVRRIADFDPAQAPFDAWLKGIAANVLKNHGRRWNRDSRSHQLDIDPPQNDRISEASELVVLALTGLPARYQAVLRAKYEEKLTVNEIGQRLGSTAKAVESMLSRAREALRRAYDKLQIEE